MGEETAGAGYDSGVGYGHGVGLIVGSVVPLEVPEHVADPCQSGDTTIQLPAFAALASRPS